MKSERGTAMPSVFLSPSTQEYNPYITGSGSEEYWMNQIADAMEPYLRSSGISFGRNDPSTSAAAHVIMPQRTSPPGRNPRTMSLST